MRRWSWVGIVFMGVVVAGCSSTDQSALGLSDSGTSSASPSSADPANEPGSSGDEFEFSGEQDVVDTLVEEVESTDISGPVEKKEVLETEPPFEVSESGLRTVPPGCRALGSSRINCNDADLRGYDLTGLRVGVFSSFWDANLAGARFDGASLQLATFSGANLTGASFEGADLSRASFNGAGLTGANFRGANLTGARVSSAQAEKANFTGARLDGTSFNFAEMSGAIWSHGRVCLPFSYGTCR